MRDEEPEDGARDEVQAVLAGDPAALDRWYRSEHPDVWRLCLGFSADADQADDLAQEAMLKIHDRLAQWDPTRPYPQWRNSVVLNLCRDRRRRTDARQRAESRAAEAAPPAVLPDPSRELEQSELRALFEEALRRLSEREREAFVLRELEGVSIADAAGLLGIAESSLRSLLTLARRRLREFLGRRAPELVGGGDHA